MPVAMTLHVPITTHFRLEAEHSSTTSWPDVVFPEVSHDGGEESKVPSLDIEFGRNDRPKSATPESLENGSISYFDIFFWYITSSTQHKRTIKTDEIG
jgi:hypothetical protein